jgi:hypothetical protein
LAVHKFGLAASFFGSAVNKDCVMPDSLLALKPANDVLDASVVRKDVLPDPLQAGANVI